MTTKTTFDPLTRRQELWKQLDYIEDARDLRNQRLAEINDAEGSRDGRPVRTWAAIRKAEVATARGETGAPEQLAELRNHAEAVQAEVAELLDANRMSNDARRTIQSEITRLHREHARAFLKAAREQAERAAETMAELPKQYMLAVGAWQAAEDEWTRIARDLGLATTPPCPLPPLNAVQEARCVPTVKTTYGDLPVDRELDLGRDDVNVYVDGKERVVLTAAGSDLDGYLSSNPAFRRVS